MRLLRCYAVGRGDEWEAVCLDLCLAVQGSSFDDVEAKLRASVDEHADFIESLPDEDRAPVLRRRAPIGQYLEFYSIALRSIFRRDKDDQDDRDGREERIPLFCPA